MTKDHIANAIAATGVQVRVIGAEEKRAILIRLRDRLGVDVANSMPWADAAAPEGRLRIDGWELIPKHVGAASCLVFMDKARDIWEFQSGNDLLAVLRECPALEFYVCDLEASYLLCSNHHDFVVGWGGAQSWVESLAGA